MEKQAVLLHGEILNFPAKKGCLPLSTLVKYYTRDLFSVTSQKQKQKQTKPTNKKIEGMKREGRNKFLYLQTT